MKTVLAIGATVALTALMGLIIWAHEQARPFIQIRRELAAEEEEGD